MLWTHRIAYDSEGFWTTWNLESKNSWIIPHEEADLVGSWALCDIRGI